MKADKQKTKKTNRWLLLLVLGIALAVIALNIRSCIDKRQVSRDTTQGIEFEKEGELTFLTANGSQPIVRIDIELAEDDYERAMGLMHRYTMDEQQGMLFIMDREEPQSFWMKNTHISLDILYVNEAYDIVSIHKYTQPFSTKSLPSVHPTKYVVEVIAGFCDKHRITEGDQIRFERQSTN